MEEMEEEPLKGDQSILNMSVASSCSHKLSQEEINKLYF